MTLRLKLKLQHEVVELEGEDDSVQEVKVCELAGPDAELYQNSIKDRLDIEVDGEGKMKVKAIKSFVGMYESLLALCLRDKHTNQLIPVDIIRTYSASVQKALFELAQKLNGLNAEGKNQAKNA